MNNPEKALQALRYSPQRNTSSSLQEEIYLHLIQFIQSGKVEIGDYLPSTRALAKQFGKSITPVNQALARLEKEGFVKCIHGSGVRVNARTSQESSAKIKPVVELITTLRAFPTVKEPSLKFQHILPAVEEWLFWRLSGQRSMRLTVSNLSVDDNAGEFTSQLRDALILRPKVLVFAYPEDFSDEIADYLKRLRSVGTYVVFLATRRDLPELDRVSLNFESGQYQLTQHLLRQGHRCIIRLCTNANYLFEQQKQAGFIRALGEYGFPQATAQEWTIELPPLNEFHGSNEKILEKTLRSIKDRFPLTALMAYNDPAVAPLRLIARKLDLQPLEIAGFDGDWKELQDEILSNHGPEALEGGAPPTVDTHLPQAAEALAELVLGRVANALPGGPQRRMIEQTLELPSH
ncbi:MAG: GntR family transcriptional regulator [Candidatus Methylacidiphilales bacterium]|nr:GntR family transcriptional regulator [Candidatus Methylacidiphilales bacterium]